MGLDAMLFIPTAPRPLRPEHPDLRGLPVRFDPQVKTETWKSEDGIGREVLHKAYTTPAGQLETAVRLSGDWPHGDRVPFVDDYQVPRAIKPLVTGPEDLEPLS